MKVRFDFSNIRLKEIIWLLLVRIKLSEFGISNQINNQKILKGHKAAVVTLAFSEKGNLLASGSEDKTVIFWNYIKGE